MAVYGTYHPSRSCEIAQDRVTGLVLIIASDASAVSVQPSVPHESSRLEAALSNWQ